MARGEEEQEHDIFCSGMSILFQEPEINCGDHGTKFKVQFPGLKAIECKIGDVDPMHIKLFAHHVWKASILLAKIIIKRFAVNVDTGKDVGTVKSGLTGKDVLELGAGAGIPSIIACLLGGNIVSSDYNESNVIANLKTNLSKNCKGLKFKVLEHNWGERNDLLFPIHGPITKFDCILMADTLWMDHQHDNLLKDISALLKQDGIVLGVAGLHTGKTVFQNFFKRAENYGFIVHIDPPTAIPLGAGFSEEIEWETVDPDSVSDDPRQRLRFLYSFKLELPVHHTKQE